MIKNLGNILVVITLLFASSGILVNKHFSGDKLYSTSFYFDAESCCESIEIETIHETCTAENSHCCEAITESVCCANPTLNKNSQSNNANFEAQTCCSNESVFLQLTEIFPQKSDKKLISNQNILNLFLIIFVENKFLEIEPKLKFIKESPPLIFPIAAYIKFACFLC